MVFLILPQAHRGCGSADGGTLDLESTGAGEQSGNMPDSVTQPRGHHKIPVLMTPVNSGIQIPCKNLCKVNRPSPNRRNTLTVPLGGSPDL